MSSVPPPVDTLEPPHEPVVPAPWSIGLWIAMLAGPVIWFAHFMGVYLLAEAVCTPEMVGGDQPWSDTALAIAIVAVTVAAVALCAVAGVYSWRRTWSADAGLRGVGVALAIGSTAAILAVGLSVTLLEPC